MVPPGLLTQEVGEYKVIHQLDDDDDDDDEDDEADEDDEDDEDD